MESKDVKSLSSSILTFFHSVDIKLSDMQSDLLAQRCSSVEGALEYFLMNENVFTVVGGNTSNNNDSQNNKGSNFDKVPDNHLSYIATNEVYSEQESQLLQFGFPIEKIKQALLRSSTIEGAFAYLCDDDLPHHEPVYSCPLCMEELNASDMITLSCIPTPHRYCKDCFIGYCTNKITDKLIKPNELCCPQLIDGVLCATPITIFELQAHLPSPIFDKYELFTTKSYCEDEELRRCPKCNDWYTDVSGILLDENYWKSITCALCNHVFCAKCGEKPHKGQIELNIDCAAYALWRQENEKGDDSFVEYMKEHKVFPCPECHQGCERNEGCKFLTCKCGSHHCALCGIQLSSNQHYSHFQNGPGCTGPFGEGCLGVADTAGVKLKVEKKEKKNKK
eukprot:gene11977-16031_t